jgi:hypothetical protein
MEPRWCRVWVARGVGARAAAVVQSMDGTGSFYTVAPSRSRSILSAPLTTAGRTQLHTGLALPGPIRSNSTRISLSILLLTRHATTPHISTLRQTRSLSLFRLLANFFFFCAFLGSPSNTRLPACLGLRCVVLCHITSYHISMLCYVASRRAESHHILSHFDVVLRRVASRRVTSHFDVVLRRVASRRVTSHRTVDWASLFLAVGRRLVD